MFPDKKRHVWFQRHTEKVVMRCRRTATTVPGFSDRPVTIYVPGGDDKYPSFWIRDAVMECRSGYIPLEEMEIMALAMLSFQNGPDCVKLAHRLRIDPWAIPDHIVLPGLGNAEFRQVYKPGAVFYPGSYSSGNDQGDGYYGVRPADDDIYEVVQLVSTIVASCGVTRALKFLGTPVRKVPVLERLRQGFQAMAVDRETGLHWNVPVDWSASNFHDGLKPMGAVSLTSCLRFRAACQMAILYDCAKRKTRAEEYRHLAEKLAQAVRTTFQRKDGWFFAATQVNCQPDTWATAMAVYYGLLKNEYAAAASEALAKSCRDGSLALSGYLRHTPVWADDIPGKNVWEDARMGAGYAYGSYQSGGYWPQPLGYVCWSIARTDRPLAANLARDFIDHTMKYQAQGAPFEWLNPAVLKEQPGEGRWYGPSAALPLEGFRRLAQEE